MSSLTLYDLNKQMYSQMNEGLPKLNSWVEFEGEKYKVASMNLLTNTVRLDASTKSKMITPFKSYNKKSLSFVRTIALCL